MNIPRKRSGSNSKKTKEKYELLFKNEDSEEITENFLHEVINSNIVCENFETEVMKIVNIDQSAVVRRNLNLLFKQCLKTLDSGEKSKYCATKLDDLLVESSREYEKDCK